jgi:hypothetical protein
MSLTTIMPSQNSAAPLTISSTRSLSTQTTSAPHGVTCVLNPPLFGTGEKLKQAAVEVLLEAAPGFPNVATARTYATVNAELPKVELSSIGGLLGDILAEHDAPTV